MPKSDSGFNEEQLLKLVAMFDTPYRNEAIVVFNKALDELATDQRRFCDRLVDATESKTAKAKCKRVRTELAGAFEKLAKREAEGQQLEETISRLHQQIKTMEEAHKASAAEEPGPEFDPVPDYGWPDQESAAPFEAQTENHSVPKPQDFSFDFTATPVAEPVFSALEPAPSLLFGVEFFWLSLLVMSLLVTLWSVTVRRPLTDDDWRNAGSLVLLLTPFGVGGLYLWGRRKGFARSSFGELCVAHLDGPKAMFTGLYLALWAYYLISLFLLDGRDDVSAYRHVGVLGLGIALVFFGGLLTHEMRSSASRDSSCTSACSSMSRRLDSFSRFSGDYGPSPRRPIPHRL